MAWVPYRESVYFPFLDVQFFDSFTPLDDSYLPDGSTMGAPVAADAPGGRIGVMGSAGNVDNDEFTNRVGFSINLVGAPVTAINIRVTPLFCDVREFAWGGDTNKEVLLHEPAQFIADTGFYVNQSATFKHTDPPGNLDDVYSIPVWTPRADIENVYSPADSATFLATASLTYRPSAISYNTGPGLSAYSRNEYGVFLIEIEDPAMTSYNCDCDDENPSRTLDELRTALTHALGFVPPLAINYASTSTLDVTTMRLGLISSLGFFGSVGADSQATTLAQVRTYLNARLGFAANATPAPGHYALLDTFINEAQDTAFRRFEYGSSAEVNPGNIGDTPLQLVADSDVLTVDPAAVKMLALGNAKAHFGHQDARVLLDQFEAYLKAQMARQPPNLNSIVLQHIGDAQRTVWRRYGYDTYGNTLDPDYAGQVGDGDSLQVDPHAVRMLALGTLKAYYNQPDAKIYLDQYETYIKELNARTPPNLRNILTTILQNAQEQLYRKYTVLRTERFYSWPLVEGVRFYDFADNAETCVKKMDPRRISWVGVSDESNPQNGWWRPLVAGIKPEFYSIQDQTSWPTHYEIRQCIEVWPVPDASTNTLRIKGHFGLEPFAADTDKCTIDDTAVYLFALANAKGHFRQPDAAAYMKQAQDHIRDLTSGLHQTRRYVPREEGAVAMPRPQWTGPI